MGDVVLIDRKHNFMGYGGIRLFLNQTYTSLRGVCIWFIEEITCL